MTHCKADLEKLVKMNMILHCVTQLELQENVVSGNQNCCRYHQDETAVIRDCSDIYDFFYFEGKSQELAVTISACVVISSEV